MSNPDDVARRAGWFRSGGQGRNPIVRQTPVSPTRRAAGRRLGPLVAAAILVAVLGIPTVSNAAQTCGTSNGFQVCLTVPNGPLVGDVQITATVTNPTSAIRLLDFSWGSSASTSADLLADFEAPYTFTWRTDRYRDASGWINV